jgi:hypothetical protein
VAADTNSALKYRRIAPENGNKQPLVVSLKRRFAAELFSRIEVGADLRAECFDTRGQTDVDKLITDRVLMISRLIFGEFVNFFVSLFRVF